MSCADCVSRRSFLAQTALAAAALVVVEGCGDGQIGPPIPHTVPGVDPNLPTTPSVTIALSSFPGLATVGTLVDIQIERALVRTGTATFQGYSKICTHQQCITEVRNNRFECPCHGSVYAADGAVIKGPDIENSGITPLHALATTYDPAAGTVTVA